VRRKLNIVDPKYVVYYLYKGDDIVYIGATSRLMGRVQDHMRSNRFEKNFPKDFDRCEYEVVDKDDLKEIESRMIAKYKPIYNTIRTQEKVYDRFDSGIGLT
jgi:excinuclease UvrABC nuclease subunit